MEAISGGYSWDFSSIAGALTSIATNAVEAVGAAALGGVTGAIAGTIIGGVWGGNGGGILGVGSIGQGVGMIYGLVVGGIGCGFAASLVGWDKTYEVCVGVVEGVYEGKFSPWPTTA